MCVYSTALARADVLLMVCDPSAPLSAPELAFLAIATKRVATVVIVLTKTDAFGGWRQLLADDRQLLDREGCDDVEIVPVSARLGLMSLSTPTDADLATELWADSGLEPIRQLINQGLAGRSQALRMANLTRTCVERGVGDGRPPENAARHVHRRVERRGGRGDGGRAAAGG